MQAPDPRGRVIALATLLVAGGLASFEGERLAAYADPVAVPTLCMGHTQGVKLGDRATHAQCLAWAESDAAVAVRQVVACNPAVNFTANELAAFGDLTLNTGPTAVCDRRNSTMARLLDAGDVAGACAQLPRWNKVRLAGVYVPLPGLTKRREVNRVTCLAVGG